MARSRALLALALAVVTSTGLAGCLDALREDLSANVSPDDLYPRSFVHGENGSLLPDGLGTVPARGAQLSIGARATEPTIGVTDDGVLFMTGFSRSGALNRSTPTVFRSTDAGATWEDAGPKLPTGDGHPPITNDPYVYVDNVTGRVFQLDLYALLCSYLSFSDDDGASWSTQPLACGLPPGVHDHQTIATAPPRVLPTVGYPNLVYYCVNRVADSACATSLDGGLTFGPLRTAFVGASTDAACSRAGVPSTNASFDTPVAGGLTGHVRGGPDGKVFLARDYCGAPAIAVTENDGVTWTTHVIAPDATVYGHEVSLAVDEANNVYAFWIGEDGLPYYAASADAAASWTPPRSVVAPGVTATEFPVIAAGAAGRIAFAYVGSTIEGGYAGKNTGLGGLTGDLLGEPEPEEWADATWNAYVGVIEDAFADDLVITTALANDPTDPIARGLCGRTRCGGMADFIDITIDQQGRPWAAFVDVCTEACVTDATVKKDTPVGFAGTLVEGPALRGPRGALAALGLARS